MSQSNSNDQEIDIFKLINTIFYNIKKFVNISFNIVVKHFFKFFILLILGFIVGSLLSINFKKYESKIIVQPNFGSVDYLYDKVELFNSKLRANDTLFFSSIGFKSIKEISNIDIEPIIDVYGFVKSQENDSNNNFEMIKLQAEDGSISKIITDINTSKYYSYHTITLKTTKQIDKQIITNLIVNYLNDSFYFSKIKDQFLKDINEKNILYNTMLSQIDGILNKYSELGDSKSDKLVYYNDNTQLNDVLNTKSDLISKIAYNNLVLIQSDKTIKDISISINVVDSKNFINKIKFVLPILFCLILFSFLYNKKRNSN